MQTVTALNIVKSTVLDVSLLICDDPIIELAGILWPQSLFLLTAIPGEPGLADVYCSKGWWRWWWQLDYWSYKSCKAPLKSSPPTNQLPVFLQAGCPSCCPTNSVKVLKGKLSHSMDLLTPSSHGVFRLCRWPLIAPVNLGGGLPCLSSALWCQYPTLGSMDYINTTQDIAVGHIYCNVVILITEWWVMRTFMTSCNPCLWIECVLQSPWKRVCWGLENPGIWSLQFLESPRLYEPCTKFCTWYILNHSLLSSCK